MAHIAVSLGSDPELFSVTNQDQSYGDWVGGTVIPAYYSLDISDTENPNIPLPFGEVRPDGAAIEYTVTPTSDVQELLDRLRANMETVHAIVANKGMKLAVTPHAYIDPWFIDQLHSGYGNSCSLQVFGCREEICIYEDLEILNRPNPKTYPFRTTGGHIHLGVGRLSHDLVAVMHLTALLDAVLGTAGTYLCTSEQAKRRKELYGLPGLIRINPDRETIEYRCLPAQVIQTPKLAHMFFTAAQSVASYSVMAYESAPSQREAIEHFRSITGDFGRIMQRAVAIAEHNISACRDMQTDIELPADMNIQPVIQDMQSYDMPDGFDLDWGFAA